MISGSCPGRAFVGIGKSLISTKHIVKMMQNVSSIKPKRFVTYLNIYIGFSPSVLLFSDL
jgi:hypothetical protein